jgi:hypothetical protein
VGIDDIEDLLLAGSETVTTHWELRIVEEKWGEREELRLLSILSILWILWILWIVLIVWAFEPLYDSTGSMGSRQTPVRLGLDIEQVFVFH